MDTCAAGRSSIAGCWDHGNTSKGGASKAAYLADLQSLFPGIEDRQRMVHKLAGPNLTV